MEFRRKIKQAIISGGCADGQLAKQNVVLPKRDGCGLTALIGKLLPLFGELVLEKILDERL